MQRDDSIHSSMWVTPPSGLDLKPKQVDVWRISLDLPTDSVKLLESSLSVDETQRAASFHFQGDKNRFTVTHACLRDILVRYLRCKPDQLSFSIGTHGKPAIVTTSSDQGIEFNLSHSGDFALVAVAWEQKVGVDVERIRQGISSQVIAMQYFSRSEVAEFLALPSEQKEIGFFNCWTRKEAYIKAQGLGLSLPLESFDVSLTPNEPVVLRATRPDPEESAHWTLHHLNVNSGYVAALASEGNVKTLNSWDWNPAVHH